MTWKPSDYSRVKLILSDVKCADREFVLLATAGDFFALHVEYDEPCVDTGKMSRQRSRAWIVPCDAGETEIVETAFACVMRSYDHFVQEHFTYEGRRVYSPHFTIGARLAMADRQEFTIAESLERSAAEQAKDLP